MAQPFHGLIQMLNLKSVLLYTEVLGITSVSVVIPYFIRVDLL